jgi:hypothetical protein
MLEMASSGPKPAPFIASDEASKVTGALIFAGGGTTIAEGGAGRGARDFVER